jgi:hypothetical protein
MIEHNSHGGVQHVTLPCDGPKHKELILAVLNLKSAWEKVDHLTGFSSAVAWHMAPRAQ